MNRRFSADTLAVMGLLCLFVFGAAAMLLAGLQVYQVEDTQLSASFDRQTPLEYLAAKARQHDTITLGMLSDGTPALIMTVELEGEPYETRLYCTDGVLYEQFAPKKLQFAAKEGERVLDVGTLTFSRENGAIRADYVSQTGQEASLLLAPRLEGGTT